MRCFKRNFEKIGSVGPYFSDGGLKALTSTILSCKSSMHKSHIAMPHMVKYGHEG